MVFDGEDHGYGTNCANLSYRALTTAFRLAVEKNAMERFQLAQAVRATLSGLGFVMSVVGIWGDGY